MNQVYFIIGMFIYYYMGLQIIFARIINKTSLRNPDQVLLIGVLLIFIGIYIHIKYHRKFKGEKK